MEMEAKPGPIEIVAPYIAEFIGTFMLVFTVGCCSIVGNPVWNATAIAAILMVMIYAFGPVSGGHLNPSVSLACGLAGKTPWPQVLGYIVVQIGGGLLAGLVYWTCFDASATVGPKSGFGWFHVGIVEVIYTTMICFVVLNCATSARNNPANDQNHFFALAIGFVIVAGGYAAGDISGACFNPAVSLGLDITGVGLIGGQGVHWRFAYCGFQALGAVLAAILFFLCRPEERSGNSEALLEGNRQDAEPSGFSRVLSEFLGTFMLVLTVGLNLVMRSPATPWSAAAALMCMIYSLGDVSGGHFNPAVTLGVVLSRRGVCPAERGITYVCAQLAAGLLAGLLYADFHYHGPNRLESFILGPGASVQNPGTTYSWYAVFAAEATFTFMIAFVVLAVATTTPSSASTKQNFQFALAIGSCVTAGGFAIGAISGGALNPAVSWGIATASRVHTGDLSTVHWPNCLWYSLFELTGGLAAAVIFAMTHTYEYKKSQ